MSIADGKEFQNQSIETMKRVLFCTIILRWIRWGSFIRISRWYASDNLHKQKTPHSMRYQNGRVIFEMFQSNLGFRFGKMKRKAVKCMIVRYARIFWKVTISWGFFHTVWDYTCTASRWWNWFLIRWYKYMNKFNLLNGIFGIEIDQCDLFWEPLKILDTKWSRKISMK